MSPDSIWNLRIGMCKINLQTFLYTNNEQTEKKYRKTIPLTIASKKLNT
jgi:hypothetical protein